MKVAVLGAGMVGRGIAIDLSKSHKVKSFDISEANLDLLNGRANINTARADLVQYSAYKTLLKDFDIVVNAVPGFMGYKTLEAIIFSKKDVVDISFFPENALDLDFIAKENGITAIVDCGVAPGMSNLVLGYHNSRMKIESFECMVGGLPKKRVKPFEYKAPFSPVDVMEEYTRPARMVEDGKIVTKPALSDAEIVDMKNAGYLEAFNTDGLRSILFTMKHIPDMKEKTLRYPGHIDLIKSMIQAGFFDTKELVVNDQKIRPIDFTSSLLVDQWKLLPGEEEFTVMKILIRGFMDGKLYTIEYFLYDEYDKATNATSMSRTTGYTCTAAVNLVLNKLFTSKGVFPPELIGADEKCFDFIMKYLEERNVRFEKTIKQ
ncbi:MAG TPA: saccharopine dehydrogenase C-terminal domain-containing protein [Ferruginibacter sp.]|nr:saccharopine dehydrogenase C-terminal domain-containing protein [Ferruginibacter sp.]